MRAQRLRVRHTYAFDVSHPVASPRSRRRRHARRLISPIPRYRPMHSDAASRREITAFSQRDDRDPRKIAHALLPQRARALSLRLTRVNHRANRPVLPVCFSVFGVEAIVARYVVACRGPTISPFPRSAASWSTHWGLLRRFQSDVNPTRTATSSFVGHFSGWRTHEPPSDGRSVNRRRYGGRAVNRVTFHSVLLIRARPRPRVLEYGGELGAWILVCDAPVYRHETRRVRPGRDDDFALCRVR